MFFMSRQPLDQRDDAAAIEQLTIVGRWDTRVPLNIRHYLRRDVL